MTDLCWIDESQTNSPRQSLYRGTDRSVRYGLVELTDDYHWGAVTAPGIILGKFETIQEAQEAVEKSVNG